MNVTLLPALTSSDKIMLRSWLVTIFSSEGLDTPVSFPLRDESIQLYVDRRVCRVYKGTWQLDMPYLYLGLSSERVIVRDRLAILGALVQLCDPSEELSNAVAQAVTRYLLGEYRELSQSLISATVTPQGIAFSDDGRVASLLGEEWMLPSGEIVDVTGWNVCATVLPASETPVPPAVGFNPAFPVAGVTDEIDF